MSLAMSKGSLEGSISDNFRIIKRNNISKMKRVLIKSNSVVKTIDFILTNRGSFAKQDNVKGILKSLTMPWRFV